MAEIQRGIVYSTSERGSRLFDSNGAAKIDQMKQTSAIMVPQPEAIPSPNQCG